MSTDKDDSERYNPTTAEDAVKYYISVMDEVTAGNWRKSPDHVNQKFLKAEKTIKENANDN
jgi:hypothetical protein